MTDMWYMIMIYDYDMIYDWYVIYGIWLVFDIWLWLYVISDCDMPWAICDMWYTICDIIYAMWYMIWYDICVMIGYIRWNKYVWT